MSKFKRLYRSTDDRMIAGVSGGFAEYFGIDPVIVRVTAVLLLIVGIFPAVIAYMILWIVVPEQPKSKSKPQTKKS